MRASSTAEQRLEIQIHPSDIQRGVRYLFFSRRQLVGWALLGCAYLALVGFALWKAPAVVKTLLARPEYSHHLATVDELENRFVAVADRYDTLLEELSDLQLQVGKVYLAYGLENQEFGQGGYPIEAEEPQFESRLVPQIQEINRLEAGLQEGMKVLDAFLREIQYLEAGHLDQAATTPSISPLQGTNFVLTSPFGTRRSPFTKALDFHAGIDLAAPVGKPIYAPADGQVVFAGRYPLRQSASWFRYGNLVSIRHGERFITIFGHCEEVRVRSGQRVKQGEIIGVVGNTGWSTNPHLHYEIRRLEDDGEFRPIDPRIYILDHRWRDEEQLLVRARSAPALGDFEPLPRLIRR